MSGSGKIIITHSLMTAPLCFSVSNDDIIYLADSEIGAYQSNDDGITWNLVFKSINEWHCEQVIKVTTDLSHDFWTLESRIHYSYHHFQIHVYSAVKARFGSNVTCRDINVLITDGRQLDLSTYSRLSYDGNMHIFVSEFKNEAVHVFSVTGHYQYHLLSARHLQNIPSRIFLLDYSF